ncbi:MAG: DNA repair protein RadC [Thermoanaerobaculaceae bacterium]|nr:DNA repair protein RadC [Thermoanaerobaculaceae bacterium]MDI9621033.1 DNA repair protein RadC [Acidobacteriota bacterium]NLH11021.1 DNA repair protein RadC [Holophagae bacterium]HPW55852.1 DNA repair protein RadC [Thermoanaerobaculaceae bacterium]
MRIADLPREQRPREKLIAHGPDALSDGELVAILLGTGIPGLPVVELADRWLAEVGGLDRLAALDLAAVLKRKGIGPAKGCVLAAALELGRRLARQRLQRADLLDRPELIADWLAPTYAGERVEVFGCLTLNSRHHLVRCHELHRGSRSHADVEPSEVFHKAILDGCHALVVWHNHPSGDPTPSDDDVQLTKRLADAGRLLRIAVLDHLVIARGAFVSLRQRGLGSL